MKDYVVRVTAGDGAVRAFAARITNLSNEAQRLHGLHPVAAAALVELWLLQLCWQLI